MAPTLAVGVSLAVAVATLVPGIPSPLRLVPGCTSIDVSSSIEPGKVSRLQRIADAYNDADRRVGGRCVEVTVRGTTSGRAMQALRDGWHTRVPDGVAQPEAWLPTSSMWFDLLLESGEVDGLTPDDRIGSIAQSLLVVAMPETMASVLGWPAQSLTWERIQELSNAGWAQQTGGDPAWGDFSFAKDDPRLSTSGLAATVATFDAAAQIVEGRQPGELRLEDVNDPDVRAFVQRVEAGVHNYDDDIVVFLQNLARYYDARDPMNYFSAVLLQEQLVYEYNNGHYSAEGRRPTEPLRTFYPTGGTLALDHPFVVLPSARGDQARAARDFYDYLREPEQQDLLTEVGFRRSDDPGQPGDLDEAVEEVLSGEEPVPGAPSLVQPPTGDVLAAMLAAWEDLRKPANILLVLDTSQSMTETLPDGRTRLQTMQEAVEGGLRHLLGQVHAVGLWTFPSGAGGLPYEARAEVEPLDEGQRHGLEAAIRDLQPRGPTPLYDTVAAAYQRLVEISREQTGPERINAVVVLTDGGNETGDENSVQYDDVDALVDEIEARSQEPGQPLVQVFPIAFGSDAAYSNLQQIANASSAQAYDARDPSRPLDQVFLEVVDNF